MPARGFYRAHVGTTSASASKRARPQGLSDERDCPHERRAHPPACSAFHPASARDGLHQPSRLTPSADDPSIPICPPSQVGERSKGMDATNKEATSQEAPIWETPTFVEIRMDAEVGSYQDDFDGQDYH